MAAFANDRCIIHHLKTSKALYAALDQCLVTQWEQMLVLIEKSCDLVFRTDFCLYLSLFTPYSCEDVYLMTCNKNTGVGVN